LKEITQWTRIGVFPSKTPAAQGAQYYNEHIVKDKRDAFVKGNSVAYLYVSHPPIGKPPTKYAAYREEEDLDGFEIDKKAVIEKLVERKIKAMFKVLGWDLEAAMGAPRPATYW